jgi:Na+/melibiose symporter-like transporter
VAITALGVGAASFLLAGFALLAAALVVTLRAARSATVTSRVRDDLRAGLRQIGSNRPLRAVTAATCLASFGAGALTPAAVLLGIRAGHRTGGGLLITAFGASALLATLVIARFPLTRYPAHRVLLVCMAGCGLALGGVAGVAFAPAGRLAWPMTVALFAVAGLFDGPLFTALLQVRSAQSPPRLRTQIFVLGAGFKTTAASLGSAAFTLVAGGPAGLAIALIAVAHLLAVGLGAILLG